MNSLLIIVLCEFQAGRAFQKQENLNINRKIKPGQNKKPLRRYRDVGLGFKTPHEVFLKTDYIGW